MKFEDAKWPVKVNVCSGRHVLDDYINVDIVPSTHRRVKGPPDILSPMHKIALPSGCASEILCVHGWEHQYRWECDITIKEWKRILQPGGKLILELPDMIKCAKNLIEGYSLPDKNPEQFGAWGLWGDPTGHDPHMSHKWGWSPHTLSMFLREYDMENITSEIPQWHQTGKYVRDMRIVSYRGRH